MARDPQIIRKRSGGVDAYGMYIGVVVYNRNDGRLVQEERFFLADRTLCTYVRSYGSKRGSTWTAEKLENGAAAVQKLREHLAELEGHPWKGVETVGLPYLVELTASDVESIRKGEPPYARYAGSVATEAAVGKIDDDAWKPKAGV